MQTNFLGAVAVTQAMLPLLLAAPKAQIINVSTELGSISQQTNTDWKYAPVKVLGYCASKAALNMLTVQLAYEFRDGNIAVNSVNPGYTATDLNGNSGPQTIEEGAAEIVRVALLDPPVTGKFFETGGEIPWQECNRQITLALPMSSSPPEPRAVPMSTSRLERMCVRPSHSY